MMQNKFRIIFRLISALFLGASTVLAANDVSLKSSYLGDGLFRYEMTVQNDLFFVEERLNFSVPFTNFIEVVEHSPGWQFSNTSKSINLDHPPEPLEVERPYSAYCIVRSVYTNHCTVLSSDRRAIIFGNLVLINEFEQGGPSVAFYNWMDTITPCSSDDADGSPPTCEWNLVLIDDLLINDLIITNEVVKGLSFSWSKDCTVLIQACTNLVQASTNSAAWTDVEYALGSAPSTNWITNEPLENFGTYYRLLFNAGWHKPNLIEGSDP